MKRTARIVDFSDPRVRENAIAEIRQARGFRWYTNDKYHRPRTLKQNSYYWAVCLIYLSDFLTEGTGEEWTEDESHLFSKQMWLPPVVKTMPDGTEYRTVKSTRDLTTKDFAQMVDSLILFLAENGVAVPEPSKFERKT